MNFPKTTIINCEVYNINVSFIKKKNSSVSIKGDNLNFRLSSYLRLNQKREHFEILLKKISSKIEKLKIKQNSYNFKEILDKGFMFNKLNFRFEISNKISGVKYKEGIFYYNPTLNIEQIEKRVIKKLISLFEKDLINYIFDMNKRTYNFPINSVNIKNLDSKWGHCTSNNDIMINVKLLNSRNDVLDYVIIHELAHIRHKNHSQAFWDEVSLFCSNHKMLRKELRENPPTMFS